MSDADDTSGTTPSRDTSVCSSACDTPSGEDAWAAVTPPPERASSLFSAASTPRGSPPAAPRLGSPLVLQPARFASPAPSEASTADTADTARYAMYKANEPLLGSSDEEDDVGDAVARTLVPSNAGRTLAVVHSPHFRAVSQGVTTGVVLGLLVGYGLHAYTSARDAAAPGEWPEATDAFTQQLGQLRQGLLTVRAATPRLTDALVARSAELRGGITSLLERLSELAARGVRVG